MINKDEKKETADKMQSSCDVLKILKEVILRYNFWEDWQKFDWR